MKILLVTDGSKFSEGAIDACRKIIAEPENTSFKIISAVEFPTMLPSDRFIGASADYYDQVEQAGHNHRRAGCRPNSLSVSGCFARFDDGSIRRFRAARNR